MASVSRMWDHKQPRFVRGHVARFAAVLFRGVVSPWRAERWKPGGHPGPPRYRKLTDRAAGVVEAFTLPGGVTVRVPFDASHPCPHAAKACERKGFRFVSVAARNRSFRADSGKGAADEAGRMGKTIGRLMPGPIRYQGKDVRMTRSRGEVAKLRVAKADGHLSRTGRVRMVASKRPRGPRKTCIAVVTARRV